MALEREFATFQRHADRLKVHVGSFVLIHEDEIFGTFAKFESAMQEGYKLFGLEPFMVQEVEREGTAQFLSTPSVPNPTVVHV